MTETLVIPPGAARLIRVPARTLVGVRDLEGHQSCELVAFVADDLAEYLDCSVTMEVTGRLFPTEKSKFYTNRYEPLLTLVEDSVGSHDLLQPASSADSRRLFLGEDGRRPGTREATLAALAAAGLAPPHLPRPVHLFRRTVVDSDGNFAMMETPSTAGQGVVFSCERPCVLVFAVSDDEISPVTGCNPTPIQIELAGSV
jgi:uncharacterized protein YcgI (DUF1989 family)